MHWYLIWFFVVTLPSGETRETIEARMEMPSQAKCMEAILIKQEELENMLGQMGRVYGRTIVPTGGRGVITGVSVGCVER